MNQQAQLMKRTAYSSTLEENLFLNRFNPREEVFNSSKKKNKSLFLKNYNS
jgi:hypothetical protein